MSIGILRFASVLMTSVNTTMGPPLKQESFGIQAEVLFALERGPVVVRVVLLPRP